MHAYPLQGKSVISFEYIPRFMHVGFISQPTTHAQSNTTSPLNQSGQTSIDTATATALPRQSSSAKQEQDSFFCFYATWSRKSFPLENMNPDPSNLPKLDPKDARFLRHLRIYISSEF